MSDEKKGRPKATRKFKWDGKAWLENKAYDPEKNAAQQPEPQWVDAMGPDGKPVPNGEEWGMLPDAMKFLPIWQSASCIEDVKKKIWWCSDKQLRNFRTTLNAYLEPKGIKKLKILRSRAHLFGSSDAQAGRNIEKLIKDGVLTYIPAADR
mgnify:CR=1 FL=1